MATPVILAVSFFTVDQNHAAYVASTHFLRFFCIFDLFVFCLSKTRDAYMSSYMSKW